VSKQPYLVFVFEGLLTYPSTKTVSHFVPRTAGFVT